MKAAQVDNARGWRAAAWVLERLFPADYSARMQERFAYRSYQDVQRDREDRAILDEDLKELWRARDEQLDREEEPARQKAAAAEAEVRAAASEADSHNSRNSGEPEPSQKSERPETSCAHSVTHSHNSRNSGDPLPSPEPREANGEAVQREASRSHSVTDSHNSRNSFDPLPSDEPVEASDAPLRCRLQPSPWGCIQ
ncbi:MAG: hypothetical protein JWQ83_587 [Lacunisphaera sp.]|nr:hypothetical protein [Lacunisphaera sp.]